MEIYNNYIESIIKLINRYDGRKIEFRGDKNKWADAGRLNLVMKSEMAFELGGSGLPAVTGIGFTSSDDLVRDDEVILYGPDLYEIKEDSPYARLAFIRINDEGLDEADDMYSLIRKIEYIRYSIRPKGYMMRISAANERENVRISREALKEGMDFKKVGRAFIEGYHSNKRVKAVKLIFITIPQFDYTELEKLCSKGDKITETLNHIFKDFKMDCATCGLKTVCDEVEGLREMHKKSSKIK